MKKEICKQCINTGLRPGADRWFDTDEKCWSEKEKVNCPQRESLHLVSIYGPPPKYCSYFLEHLVLE